MLCLPCVPEAAKIVCWLPELRASPFLLSGPSGPAIQQGTYPTSGLSCLCQPSIGRGNAEFHSGAAARGANQPTLHVVKALSTEAVTLERYWLPGPNRLNPSVSGPQQEPWEGPASALCAERRDSCLLWRRALSGCGPRVIFVNRVLNQPVTPTPREV